MEEENSSSPVKSEGEFMKKMKSNPWMGSTAVLGIIAIILLAVLFYPRITGNVVSGSSAGVNLVDYLNTRTGGGVSFVSSEEMGANLYSVMVSYQNQTIPVFVTKDGKYFVQGAIPMSEDATNDSASDPQTQQPANVPKSDKPKVEGFFFSYCPYGTQFEKAMVPVYNLLKNKADIGVVFIGAMHGEFERVESLRQICIEKNYGRDKLFSYLKAFNENSEIGACSGKDTCVNPLIDKIYTSQGIDKAKIEACMAKDAPAIYDAQVKQSSSLGISGSPTFVINGVQVQVDRSPEAIKKAICDSFVTTPSECNTVLSTTAASPGFGAAAGTSTGASC